MNVSGISHERLAQIKFIFEDEVLRAYVNEDGLKIIAAHDSIVGRLKSARSQAHRDAIKNLARTKFTNFGYHAARWVTLNAIIGDKQPNPFKCFVDLAREILNGDRKS